MSITGTNLASASYGRRALSRSSLAYGRLVVIKYAVLYRTLERIAEGKWRVYYLNYLLGYCDEKETRIMDDQGRFRRAEKKCKGCA